MGEGSLHSGREPSAGFRPRLGAPGRLGDDHLRGVEESLLVSVFGSLHHVTWARILATVLGKAEERMGEFNHTRFRLWAACNWYATGRALMT